MNYLILCLEGPLADECLWWKPNRCGYTTDVDAAGRYTREEALRIIDRSDRADFAVPEEEATRRTKRVVVREIAEIARLTAVALEPTTSDETAR